MKLITDIGFIPSKASIKNWWAKRIPSCFWFCFLL